MIPIFNKAIKIQQILNYNSRLFHILKRMKSTVTVATSSPETFALRKNVEQPILVIAENNNIDIIGPPNSLSNLRPIIRKKYANNETSLQQRLRELQDSTQLWNQEFWATHNTNFINERKEFVDRQRIPGEEPRQLTAEEMSEFYKQFLDKNWQLHANYNWEWYKRNFTLLYLAFRVQMQTYLAKFS